MSRNNSAKSQTEKGTLRRWFSTKRNNKTAETLAQVKEKQEEICKEIVNMKGTHVDVLKQMNAFCTKLDTLVSDAGCRSEMKCCHSMERGGVDIQDILKTINEVKQTVGETREHLLTNGKRRDELSENIQLLTNQKHKIELEQCRLQVENQYLNKETADLKEKRLSCKNDTVALQLNETIERLTQEMSRLEDNVHRNVAERLELEYEIKILVTDKERLNENIRERDECIDKLNGSRKILLNHLQQLRKEHQVKQRSAWNQCSELRKEMQSKLLSIQNHPKQVIVEPNYNEELATKILDLDLKLYRRNQLIDYLIDKLNIYDKQFDITDDPACLAYLDDDYRPSLKMIEDTVSVSESPVSTSLSSVCS